jgi:MYXO-CTERM domain-containing protein
MPRAHLRRADRAPLAAAAILTLTGTAAHGQWSWTDLHPAPATSHSVADGVRGGQQVGWVGVNAWRPALWNNTAASFTDLTPAGYVSGFAHSTSGANQVGRVSTDHVTMNAALWSGTAASFVNLHPAGAGMSQAHAVDGGQQGGVAFVGGLGRAALWSGSAASFVDLTPATAIDARVNGLGAGQQSGSVDFGIGNNAALWTGSAASFVNLNPAGAGDSQVRRAHGLSQVGYATVIDQHAALWTGSAASFVDLNPAGAAASEAWGVFNSLQVGWARLSPGGPENAAIWSGTAGSFFNLHSILPGGYSSSIARQVWVDGLGDTWVAGEAYMGVTSHAMLWHLPVPAPGAATGLALLGAAAVHRRRRT